MSIASEINRISQNVSDSLEQVALKGVTVPSDSTSDDLPDLIAQIQTGGGSGTVLIEDTLDSHGGIIRTITAIDAVQGTKTITENGTGIDVASYQYADVNVQNDYPTFTIFVEYDPTEITCDKTYAECLTCWQNADYRATFDFVLPISESETVTRHFGAAALEMSTQEGWIKFGAETTGDPVNDVFITYHSSGTFTFDETPVPTRSSSDLTVSGATVTAPSGYYPSNATKTVASGTEGTPTATKGTVSNHSITVTPSVTNTAGYIPGGTQTGTAVTVSASELVSGSETKTANGTYDVTNLAQLIVNVSGGGGLVYETGTYTPTSDVTSATVSFANTHSTLPAIVVMAEASNSLSSWTNYSLFEWNYINTGDLFGGAYPRSSAYLGYGRVDTIRKSNTSSLSASNANTLQYPSSATQDDSATYPRYWVTASSFKAYASNNSYYWRSGRTYKWIAVWAPTT